MFQVLTGESWSEVVARPLLFGNSTFKTIITGFYFVSFILIVAVVLINVVIAVLLEKMVEKEEDEDEVEEEEQDKEESTEQEDENNMREDLTTLSCQVAEIFRVMDALEPQVE